MKKSNLQDYYKKRLSYFQEKLKKLKSKNSVLGWVRLGPLMLFFAAFYFMASLGWIYLVFTLAAIIAVFIKLLHLDLDNRREIEHIKLLIEINSNELLAVEGNYSAFNDGIKFADNTHPYTNDLDIFGRSSVYQYLNRTTSQFGELQLANSLKSPLKFDDIKFQQDAVKELADKNNFLQMLMAAGISNPVTEQSKNKLQNWIEEPSKFIKNKIWIYLSYILPFIIFTITVLFIFDFVPNPVFYGALLVYAFISYRLDKKISPIHNELSGITKQLEVFAESSKIIERENFISKFLIDSQKKLKGNLSASESISSLKNILGKLDLRYNLVLAFPLNIFLLWNLRQVLNLEKWKENQKVSLDDWFNALGYFEATGSFAVSYFNNPHFCFAEVNDNYFNIEAHEAGHPLIPKIKRVNNPVNIPSRNEIMIVTGSNMAGKSTYLRCIGVNTVLALAGGAVCAKYFKISHCKLISSMRITDNLEESTSTFYAELKKLKSIIDKINEGEKLFILLDEILRGTNSIDRQTGSIALIKQFIEKKYPAIIATHDLELARLKESFPDKIENYNFDVRVDENDKLFFDYKLKQGICTSLNASILMKQIGIMIKD